MIEKFNTAQKLREEWNNQYEEEIHHTNNPVLDPPSIEKKYLKPIRQFIQQDNSFYFHDGVATVEVKVVSDEIIRVRLAPNSSFLKDFSYAVSNSTQHVDLFDLTEDDTSYRVRTNTVTCVIEKETALVSFVDRDGKVFSKDATPMHWEENADFGGYYVYNTKDAAPNESFFGLGDKPTHLNLRGKRLVNWNSDTYSFGFNRDPLYKSIPFYVGLKDGEAYGIFFDNTFKTYFDFAAEDPAKTSFWSEGGELQYYYIHGPAMEDVIKRYHLLTGTHYLPPKWALGYHQCRWSYYPEAKVRDLAKQFRDRKIPCDAIYLDIDYMDGYRCFTWNKKYFPDHKKMIADLSEDGFQTVVMIDPGIKVDENYWVYKEADKNNYFCRRGDDYFMEGYVWPGRCKFPDFTNPEVRKWWGGLYKDLVDSGVSGVWNDMNEPAVFGRGTFPNDVRHQFDGQRGSHRKAHNIYGMQMVRATYDGLKALLHGKRPFTITRAAYSGTQRYASVWTGDNVATWEHLKIGSLQLQRLAMSGLSFCGTDIGGFSGEPSAELFSRWLQFGVFSPFMRAHSAGDTAEREPWSFGEEYEAINRKFIELRYQLLSYIYTVFREHAVAGKPILKPLIMLEQSDDNHNREEEFSFGDKILVSPVLEDGQRVKTIYLPKGYWYDYWTHALMTGGEEHSIETPLDQMPMFIKAGTVLPINPIMQHVNEKVMDDLALNIYYLNGSLDSNLYEDDGESYAYENEYYIDKKFKLQGTETSLTVQQSREGRYHTPYTSYKIKLIGLPFNVNKVLVDNDSVDFEKDKDGSLHLVVGKGFDKIMVS